MNGNGRKSLGPPLASLEAYKKLMKRYFYWAKIKARFRGQVGWITSGGPVEFLWAMGVVPFYPENHSAMCGAVRVSVDLCQLAENQGYSPDLCSYAKTDLGSNVKELSPLKGRPNPTLFLACNNICNTVVKWWEIQARHFQVPLFLLDTPFIYDQVNPETIDYVVRQMEELVTFLEKATGRTFKMNRFQKVLERSAEGVRLWSEILDLCRHRPTPLTSFDAFVHMAPIVTLRGTRSAVKYYRRLKKELEDRVARGLGAVPGEKYRILWDNIPIWYEMRPLSKALAEHGLVLVADSYTSSWAFEDLDAGDPIRSLATAYTTVHLNRGLDFKTRRLADMMEKYQADGFILHSNMSCKPYSFGQYEIKRRLTALTGKPGIVLESDMVDGRKYDRARAEAQIKTLAEMLAG